MPSREHKRSAPDLHPSVNLLEILPMALLLDDTALEHGFSDGFARDPAPLIGALPAGLGQKGCWMRRLAAATRHALGGGPRGRVLAFTVTAGSRHATNGHDTIANAMVWNAGGEASVPRT